MSSDLTVSVYGYTGSFPKEERYGLISQMRRASISALANIAEGAGRKHKKEYLNFLYIAKGSLSELEALLEIANRLHFLRQSDFIESLCQTKKTARCLFGLIRAVEFEVHGPRSIVQCPSNKGGIHA